MLGTMGRQEWIWEDWALGGGAEGELNPNTPCQILKKINNNSVLKLISLSLWKYKV